MLSEIRDEAAATAFFKQAINNNGFPDKVVMDKSGANYAGLANINLLLILAGFATMIDICQVKYLNNIIEQDHRFIKKITKPMNILWMFIAQVTLLDRLRYLDKKYPETFREWITFKLASNTKLLLKVYNS